MVKNLDKGLCCMFFILSFGLDPAQNAKIVYY